MAGAFGGLCGETGKHIPECSKWRICANDPQRQYKYWKAQEAYVKDERKCYEKQLGQTSLTMQQREDASVPDLINYHYFGR